MVSVTVCNEQQNPATRPHTPTTNLTDVQLYDT